MSEFRDISPELGEALRSAVEESKEVLQRSVSLVDVLKSAFDERLAAIGIEFIVKSEAPLDVLVRTPLGVGRLRLEWRTNADGVVGRLVVDRSTMDRYDVPVWEAVWAITIPPYGDITAGDSHGQVIRLNDLKGISTMKTGLAILYAIANGPQFA